jgi:hypothetical protein
MNKHIIVYSHGFGVRKDDRGLFTDIAQALPGAEHVMFDYDEVDEAKGTLTAATLTDKAAKLAQVLEEARLADPDAALDVICHSQGCVVAAMAKPVGVRKVILLAPPVVLSVEGILKFCGTRPGAVIDVDGESRIPRRDGTTTIIPALYWTSLEGATPVAFYNELASETGLTVVRATQDEVLGTTDMSGLTSKVAVITMDTGHDFTGAAREELAEVIAKILG